MKTFEFFEEVYRGLTAPVKYINPKYFYDQEGNRLFQQIMNSPEYYLTGCELEILAKQSPVIAKRLLSITGQFDVVEMGAGDAMRSKYLLKELLQQEHHFTYFPIDISANTIQLPESELPVHLPGLDIVALKGEYLPMLEKINVYSSKNKLILFLSANIGNYTFNQAHAFCRELYDHLLPGDWLLTGFDLKKNPEVILNACNDKTGLTRRFNLNLLKRLNRELDADFDLENFNHFPVYDPVTGACRSYLISLSEQVVCIGEADFVYFEKDEPIYMEISQKYSLQHIKELARSSGFRLVKNFFDSKQWFADSLWRKE